MEEKTVYTIKETAKYLCTSTSTIYRMEKQGLISSIKTPTGRKCFSKEIIKRFLCEHENFKDFQNQSKDRKINFIACEPEAAYLIKNNKDMTHTANELFFQKANLS